MPSSSHSCTTYVNALYQPNSIPNNAEMEEHPNSNPIYAEMEEHRREK
jgi:hypothetical protein